MSPVTPGDRESVEASVREVTPLGITASNLTSWSAVKELRRAGTAVLDELPRHSAKGRPATMRSRRWRRTT